MAKKNDKPSKMVVTTIDNGEVLNESFENYAAASRRYEEFVGKDQPSKLEYECIPMNITMEMYRWNIGNEIKFAEATTRAMMKKRMENVGIDSAKIATIMTLSLDDITAAVISKSTFTFTELKGIGLKTAEKAIKAMHGRVTFGSVVIGNCRKQFHQRVRVTLNRDWMMSESECMNEHKRKPVKPDQAWIFDSVRKRWSNVEQFAAAISGDEFCVINVVSTIPELNATPFELAKRERAEIKKALWDNVCRDGLILNGRKYVFIGHGTNAAKENSTLWCLAEYADRVVEKFRHDVNSEWKITDAKYVAYMIGLQSVYAEPIDLPIEPEDFEIFQSLIQDIKDNIARVNVDGTVNYEKDGIFSQNQFDGFSVMHVSAKMQNVMIDRLIAKGFDRKEAIRKVNHEIAVLRGHTFRCWEAAFKGVVYTNFDMHAYLHKKGIHTLHGRDIDDIVMFSDETVLKTPIGKGKAYETKEAWCNAVRENFQYCKLLCEHDLKKKDVPYQVIQAAHKASKETVEEFAREQADELNAMHTLDQAKKCLTKEQQALIEFMPEAANTKYLNDRMRCGFYNTLDDAFGGKRVGQCFTMLLAPDVIAFAQHISGMEVTGFLNAGETCCFQMSAGEFAFWRNPVLDTGSLRVLNNVKKVPEDLKEFFTFDTSMMMINIKDTTITRVRGDYDGDKGSVSKNKKLIQMFKEAHANFGDWLVDWVAIPGDKGVVTRETQLKYASTLCGESDLGKTCCGMNILYAGKHLMSNRTIKYFECNYDEIANSTTRANNQVDAGKHGAKTYEVLASIPEKTHKNRKEGYEPLQPAAKMYRDLHDAEAKALAEGGSRDNLDKLAVSSKNAYGSLDIYFNVLCNEVDRKYHIDDLPKGELSVDDLLYDTSIGYRGMTGLCRKGEIYVAELGYRVDEGLAQSIFRRTARDYELISNENPDDSERNISDDTFNAKCRALSLAEFANFAEACGATINDVFDIVTRWVFTQAESVYRNDGTTRGKAMDVLFDQVNRGYWLIFGGMLKDRVEELTSLENSIDMHNINVAV